MAELRFVFGDQTQPWSYWQNQLGASRSSAWISARQVHGSTVQVVGHDSPRLIHNCDALLSCESGVGLAMHTADCLPIIFYQQNGPWYGIVHAGWRGLASEIVPKVLRCLQSHRVPMPSLRVVAGPHARVNCYAVGKALAEKFSSYPGALSSEYHLNMESVLRQQCESMGVPTANIRSDARCTVCDQALASFRRDGTRLRNPSMVIFV